MTNEERARAEEFIKQLRDDVSLLDDLPDKGWATVKVSDLIQAVEAFAREERARVWEEAKGLLEAQQCRNPFYGTALFKGETIKFAEWIDKVAIMFGQFAKQLREEGRDVQGR